MPASIRLAMLDTMEQAISFPSGEQTDRIDYAAILPGRTKAIMLVGFFLLWHIREQHSQTIHQTGSDRAPMMVHLPVEGSDWPGAPDASTVFA